MLHFGCSKSLHDTNLKHCLEMFPSEHTTKINIHMETMLCSLVISYRCFGRNPQPPSSGHSNNSKLHGRNGCAVQGQGDGHNELMGEVLLWHCTTLWADDAR